MLFRKTLLQFMKNSNVIGQYVKHIYKRPYLDLIKMLILSSHCHNTQHSSKCQFLQILMLKTKVSLKIYRYQ